MGIDAKVEHITDFDKILKMGVSSTPALMVNGNQVILGSLQDKKEIHKTISKALELK